MEKWGYVMKKEDIFTLIDKTYIETYDKEYDKQSRKKYRDDIYKEIYKKVSKYTKDDWNNIRERLDYIYDDIGSLMDKSPAHREVQEDIEALRQHFSNSFYNCNLNMFRVLGRLYVTDEKFRENINERKEGLAQFVSEAIEIYCNNLENNA